MTSHSVNALARPSRDGAELNRLGSMFVKAAWFVDNARIRLLGNIITCLLFLMLAGGIVGGVLGGARVTEIRELWRTFDSGSASQQGIFGDIREVLDSTSLSEHWRHLTEAPNDQQVQARAQAVLVQARELLTAFSAAGETAEEHVALEQLLAAVGAYERLAMPLPGTRTLSREQSQALMRIDSTPVRAALDTLRKSLRTESNLSARRMNDAIFEMASSLIGIQVLNSIMLIMLGIFFLWFTRWRLVRPLDSMRRAMIGLARGTLDVNIPYQEKQDEFGEMARTVEVFKQNAIDAERLAAEKATERAAKERRQAAMDHHTEDFATSASGVMASLAKAAEGMRQAACAMMEAAGGVREQASGTAITAEKSPEQLTAMAASIEQMTSSVDEISRQVTTAAQVAHEAVGRADASQNTMKGLGEAAGRIGDVVGLIRDVADQTKLLALNASIEASRAGEVGRGFAVVADQVKSLAAQTANATAEVGHHIEAVRAATNGSISAMSDVAQIIAQLDEVTSAIATAVEEQSATTREIAANVQTVTAAGIQTAAAMKQVVNGSDEAGAVSQQVLEAAGSIGQEAERLRVEVDGFLAAVRDETGNRRRYERIPGNGAMALLAGRRRPDSQVRVHLRHLPRGDEGDM